MKRLFLLFTFIFCYCAVYATTDSLLRAAGNMRPTDTSLPAVYAKLAWNYLTVNDTTSTLRYLKKSERVAISQSLPKGIMNAYSNLGMYYTRFGLIDSAVFYFTQCLDKAKSVNDVHVASKACNNVAGAYLSAGKYAEAIQYYLQAMQYLEKENDQPRIAGNYHCLGIAYYMLKNYPLSLQYYQRSLDMGITMGKPDQSGYNYNGIGVVYKDLRQYDAASYYLGKAHQDAERNNDQYLLSHNLSNMGEVYSLTGRFPQALGSLNRALAIQKGNKDQRGIAETCVLLGNTYLANKDNSRAKQYFDSAIFIAGTIGARDVMKNGWGGLSAAFKAAKDYQGALDAYHQYADLKDSLYTTESSRQIAEMQTRYNTEKKEKENILLQKENALELLQLTRERNQKYILSGSFLFLVILSLIYYNQYRLKQRSAMLKERALRAYAVFQAQEEEKGRLSKELHDGVGALLSLIKLNISIITPSDDNTQLLTRTKILATDAIREVRGISHDLMPSVLANAGLQAALTELAESINSSGSLAISLQYAVSNTLPPGIESNIFRIIQEATNNVIKHAAATKVSLNLSIKEDHLLVSISDNGKGFDKIILSKITGNGLNNIYSRVNLMKGDVTIETSKHTGTHILITIPLKR